MQGKHWYQSLCNVECSNCLHLHKWDRCGQGTKQQNHVVPHASANRGSCSPNGWSSFQAKNSSWAAKVETSWWTHQDLTLSVCYIQAELFWWNIVSQMILLQQQQFDCHAAELFPGYPSLWMYLVLYLKECCCTNQEEQGNLVLQKFQVQFQKSYSFPATALVTGSSQWELLCELKKLCWSVNLTLCIWTNDWKLQVEGMWWHFLPSLHWQFQVGCHWVCQWDPNNFSRTPC